MRVARQASNAAGVPLAAVAMRQDLGLLILGEYASLNAGAGCLRDCRRLTGRGKPPECARAFFSPAIAPRRNDTTAQTTAPREKCPTQSFISVDWILLRKSEILLDAYSFSKPAPLHHFQRNYLCGCASCVNRSTYGRHGMQTKR